MGFGLSTTTPSGFRLGVPKITSPQATILVVQFEARLYSCL